MLSDDIGLAGFKQVHRIHTARERCALASKRKRVACERQATRLKCSDIMKGCQVSPYSSLPHAMPAHPDRNATIMAHPKGLTHPGRS